MGRQHAYHEVIRGQKMSSRVTTKRRALCVLDDRNSNPLGSVVVNSTYTPFMGTANKIDEGTGRELVAVDDHGARKRETLRRRK